MEQQEIRRQSLAVLELPVESLELGAEAKDVLGYSVLLESTTEKPDPKPLEAALARLGIDILNEDDVTRYQSELMAEETVKGAAQWVKTNSAELRWGYRGPAWVPTAISEYKLPVPEFVLNKAVQIKKALPDAIIEIVHLEQNPDPFLRVRTRHPEYEYASLEAYYVEVWDEPRFEGRVR